MRQDTEFREKILELLQASESSIKKRLDGDLEKINLKLPDKVDLFDVYFLRKTPKIPNF